MNRFTKILIEDAVKFGIKAIIVFIITLLTILIGSSIFFNSSNSANKSTFEVVGKAKKEVTPDKAVLNLGTVVEGTDVNTIQQQAATKINTTVDKLVESEINKENIKTSRYDIQPRYSSDSKIIGYYINVSLQITFNNIGEDTKPVSNAINTASSAGLNQVYGLNFEISNYDQIAEELKLAAIDDGKIKKDDLAKASGIKLGRLKDVQVGEYYYPQYYDMNARTSAGSVPTKDGSSTTGIKINPGKNDIEVSVTLIYEID